MVYSTDGTVFNRDVMCTKGLQGGSGYLAEHYADDLGMDLEDSFESDYNAKLEDGSPYEVGIVPAYFDPSPVGLLLGMYHLAVFVV